MMFFATSKRIDDGRCHCDVKLPVLKVEVATASECKKSAIIRYHALCHMHK
jgi:hypothetical protein